ncbi:hypothetical protein WH50_04095 [Pokkaliibacter plantistimulans]|uniref:Type II secretion system protein H n=1 Tax=Pokkaliibacter plantistimulans TaxID=1635171 RepID=A0ABX5M0S7_9GAMM|nr:GspH/FimT family pseudopilin [Pokkaliibacter plantistimulans]PXF32516.1 hypothetical protein WH50_04095 [Pokkaliibacter plantistimulans]
MRVQGSPRHSAVTGFSLIELMVTIAVLAILAMVAVPSFTSMIASANLSSRAEDLRRDLQLARSEAIRVRANVVFCRSDDQSACTTGDVAGSWGGWIVFVDTDGDNVRDAGETILRRYSLSDSYQLISSAALGTEGNRVRFSANGFAYQIASSRDLVSGTFALCRPSSAVTGNVREVSMISGGRTWVSTADDGGACSQPSDP